MAGRPLNKAARMAMAMLGLSVLMISGVSAREFTLDSVRAKVTGDYAGVAQLPPERLQSMIGAGGSPLVLDVREAAEFAVSHLAGAERVEPGISASAFLAQFAAKAKGRPVVFYCSVGVRSSILAEKVQAALKAAGAGPVYNLDGGIFAWHNQSRSLVDASGPTELVHPYDSHWGKLLTRRDFISTGPKP
ncbi:MAG: rhodanese-like domain-containing protein [Hyphomicrobiales bacterium]